MKGDSSVVADWLESVCSLRRLRREDLYEPTDSLSKHLRSAGRYELAETFEANIDGEIPRRSSNSAELVLAEALGIFAGHNPSTERLEVVEQLLGHGSEVWKVFLDTATVELGKNKFALDAMRARLNEEPELLKSDPQQVILFSHHEIETLAESHREQATPMDLWGSHGFEPIHLRSDLAYTLLRRIDPATWVSILDRFITPELAFHLVENTTFDNIDEIAVLMGAAAPVFGEDGVWRRDAKAVFPLLTAAEEILRERSGHGRDPEMADANLFDRDLGVLLDAVELRSDFRWLGHAWLQRLAWQDYAYRIWHLGNDPFQEGALWRLMMTIALRLHPIDDPIEWISGERDPWRIDRVVAAILPQVVHNEGAHLNQTLTKLIDSNLVPSHRLAVALSTRRTVLGRTIGAGLQKLPDPSLWLETVWKGSFGNRDRLRHIRGRELADGRDPGAFAAAIACAALIQPLDDAVELPKMAALWTTLENIVSEACITLPEPLDPVWSVCARWLAIQFPQILNAIDVPADRAVLEKFLQTHFSPTRRFLEIVNDLRTGSVSLAIIDTAIGGVTTASVVDRVMDDARRLNPTTPDDKIAFEALKELRDGVLRP